MSNIRQQLVDAASHNQRVVIRFQGRQDQPCVSVGFVVRVGERTVVIALTVDDAEPHAVPIDIVQSVTPTPQAPHE